MILLPSRFHSLSFGDTSGFCLKGHEGHGRVWVHCSCAQVNVCSIPLCRGNSTGSARRRTCSRSKYQSPQSLWHLEQRSAEPLRLVTLCRSIIMEYKEVWGATLLPSVRVPTVCVQASCLCCKLPRSHFCTHLSGAVYWSSTGERVALGQSLSVEAGERCGASQPWEMQEAYVLVKSSSYKAGQIYNETKRFLHDHLRQNK